MQPLVSDAGSPPKSHTSNQERTAPHRITPAVSASVRFGLVVVVAIVVVVAWHCGTHLRAIVLRQGERN